MSKLPVVSGAECIKVLEKVDFKIVRQRGSHIVLLKQKPKTTIIVPNHKELERGTLRAIILKLI